MTPETADCIYHLAAEGDFLAGLGAKTYRPSDLAEVGFVHCALQGSVLPVANDYFAGVDGPVMLIEIDPQRLHVETRYEAPAPIAGGGRSHLEGVAEFPHVYGPIDRGAITAVGVMGRTESGFAWPSRTRDLASYLA